MLLAENGYTELVNIKTLFTRNIYKSPNNRL